MAAFERVGRRRRALLLAGASRRAGVHPRGGLGFSANGGYSTVGAGIGWQF